MKREVIGCTMLALAMMALPSQATPTNLNAWIDHYPGSTIPTRLDDSGVPAGRCNICHHIDIPGETGTNCYRETLIALKSGGMNIAEAIAAADSLDSDGDGVSNGEEILLPRSDMPGEIGFAPGLVGPTGTDPCHSNASEAVSGQQETPLDTAPAASTWGLAVMLLSLLVAGSAILGRRPLPAKVVARRRRR